MVSICYTYVITCFHCLNIIDVTDAAEIIEPIGGETEYIEKGNNITLRCVGVGYPPPLVQWRKLNGLLSDRVSIANISMSTNEGNVTNVTVDLIFTGAYREDTGVYECSVSNLLNTVTRNVSLIVRCTYVVLCVFSYVRTCVIHNYSVCMNYIQLNLHICNIVFLQYFQRMVITMGFIQIKFISKVYYI